MLSTSLLATRRSSSSSSSTTANNDTEKVGSALPRKRKLLKTQLKTDLKQYRTQQSAPLGKPAWTIFTNAVVDEIYVKLPTTMEELRDVKGIGPQKLNRFGRDILTIVAQYTDANGVARSTTETTSPPVTRSDRIDPKTLTLEQQKAAELLLSSDRPNVFVTGSAGTGKSHLLKYIVQELQDRQPTVAKIGVCAPTGVAAIIVGGNTLHSYFGIGLGRGTLPSLVKKVKANKDTQRRIDETESLIIDECSMLSSDLLEILDAITRQVRKKGIFKDQPFGGIRVICFGDFFQLPPVSRGTEKPFAFDSPVWSELGLTENMVKLEVVQRQENTEFVDLLNKVRIGQVNPRDIDELNSRCLISKEHPLPTDGIVPTRLYSLNRDVDGENESRLMALKGKEVVCQATTTWRESMPTGTPTSVKNKMVESLSKVVPDELKLKVGAQVMLTRNKALDQGLVNGSRGVVIRFDRGKDEDLAIPVVRFDNGVVTPIPRVETERYNPDGGPGCLVRKQVPLKLAWAISIHKSQGATLTRALLDITTAFEYGQCYVALSRVRSLEGLWLEKPARPHNIKVSPQVLDFYSNR